MCRHAAYIGNKLSLAKFMLDPEHNLIDQAVHPREMRVGRFNADGFGIGWFQDDGTPATYKNIQPIWSDTNLPALGAALHREQWIALIRGASPGLGISIDNTHPFSDERWMFTLNGLVADFNNSLRPAIAARLADAIAADTRGHTDAEFIFALLRQLAAEDDRATTTTLFTRLVEYLESIAGPVEIALNMLLCESDTLYATRYAINLPNPTLYYSSDYHGGHAVSSEPMGDRNNWSLLPEQCLLIAQKNLDAEVRILAR